MTVASKCGEQIDLEQERVAVRPNDRDDAGAAFAKHAVTLAARYLTPWMASGKSAIIVEPPPSTYNV